LIVTSSELGVIGIHTIHVRNIKTMNILAGSGGCNCCDLRPWITL